MQLIKTALCAYGMSGQVFHAPYIAAHPQFELYKILQRKSHSAQKDFPNVIIAKNYDDLINDQTIDLIIVNTPNHLHYTMAKQALLAGKHVLVEKPFTETIAEAEELIALAERQKRILYVYQNRRWDGDFKTVQKVVENEMLGELVYYEVNWDRFRNYIKPNTWKEDTQGGTGMLYDLGAHLIDQVMVLFGMPERLNASLRVNRKGGKVIDFFQLQLYYEDKQVSLGGSYLGRQPRPRFLLQGQLGTFVKYGLDPQEDRIKEGWQVTHPSIGLETAAQFGELYTDWNGLSHRGKIETLAGNYMELFDDLAAAIAQQKAPEVQPHQALNVMHIIEAAIKSSEEQRQVSFLQYS